MEVLAPTSTYLSPCESGEGEDFRLGKDISNFTGNGITLAIKLTKEQEQTTGREHVVGVFRVRHIVTAEHDSRATTVGEKFEPKVGLASFIAQGALADIFSDASQKGAGLGIGSRNHREAFRGECRGGADDFHMHLFTYFWGFPPSASV